MMTDKSNQMTKMMKRSFHLCFPFPSDKKVATLCKETNTQLRENHVPPSTVHDY